MRPRPPLRAPSDPRATDLPVATTGSQPRRGHSGAAPRAGRHRRAAWQHVEDGPCARSAPCRRCLPYLHPCPPGSAMRAEPDRRTLLNPRPRRQARNQTLLSIRPSTPAGSGTSAPLFDTRPSALRSGLQRGGWGGHGSAMRAGRGAGRGGCQCADGTSTAMTCTLHERHLLSVSRRPRGGRAEASTGRAVHGPHPWREAARTGARGALAAARGPLRADVRPAAPRAAPRACLARAVRRQHARAGGRDRRLGTDRRARPPVATTRRPLGLHLLWAVRRSRHPLRSELVPPGK